jgi:hypothetical protein
MSRNRLTFVLFGAAILFSIIHECSLPIACMRPLLIRSSAATQPLAR